LVLQNGIIIVLFRFLQELSGSYYNFRVHRSALLPMTLFSVTTMVYTLVKHGGENGFAEQWIEQESTGILETLHLIHSDIQ